MTDQQKQAEWQRICGDMGKRAIHSIAPENQQLKDEMFGLVVRAVLGI